MENNELENISLIEPTEVPFTFEAIGWQILAGIIISCLVVLGIYKINIYIKNKYRREAIKEINHSLKTEKNFSETVIELSVIQKQVAIKSYGRELVASLSGDEWLKYLKERCTKLNISDLAQLSEACYNKSLADNMDKAQQHKLIETLKFWISNHAR